MPLNKSITIACLILLSGTSLLMGQRSKELATLIIPKVDNLQRVDRKTRPSQQAAQNSAFVLKTKPHAVTGNKYVILTDHTQQGYFKSLERLAKHRDGLILKVSDLALLHKSSEKMDKVRKQLQNAKVKYLAIAPRMETYRENMLLGMWELISTLDDDPQIDAFPGFLLASNEKNFAALIERSINYKPQSSQEFQPFAISQVPSTRELRSLQKSGILRNLFAKSGYQTPTVAIYSRQAKEAPKLPGDQFWRIDTKSKGDFLTKFSKPATAKFNKATLLVMHGHGIPGMSCGVDIGIIPQDFSAQVVLCGSCFSSVPAKSDLPAMGRAPGGYNVKSRDAFTIRAIDNGATVTFGHMRLSYGFPHLFPVLETWMKGRTVGEAYQELMNGLIEVQGVKSGQFVVKENVLNSQKIRQNILLYVIIGDPAIQPFERTAFRKVK